jgi:hypothetical protein
MTFPVQNVTRADRRLPALIAGGLLCLPFAAPAPAATNAVPKLANSDCLDCHLDPSTTRKVDGKIVPLLFPTNAFQKSVHSMLDCTDCHTGIKDLVHDATCRRPTAPAAMTRKAKDYATSIHGMSHKLGASGAANCWDCHGSHGILPVEGSRRRRFTN